MRRSLRNSALFALAGLLAACSQPVPRAEIGARLAALGRPNLVLIVVDTLRADRTTPYGFAETTPELARWAAQGVVFEHALAQSSWTKISMASLLTSLWPRSHALREPRDGLAEGAQTLAELLRAAGYRTYAVQTNGWLHQSFGFHQGFERYVFPSGRGARLPRAGIWPHVDRVVEEAARLLDAHERDAPFFLYLHFMDVHEYAAPPEFKRFGTDAQGAYLAAVHWVDDGIRRVREALEARGVAERTLLVLASDHGESLGEHGVQGHARDLRAPVLRVPLVIRLPFSIEPIRIATQVRNLDLAPTLLELAQQSPAASFEGASLWPLVRGDAVDAADRPSFSGLGVPLFPDAAEQAALAERGWSYARHQPPDARAGEEWLFDLTIDPDENVNLARREPRQAERLRAQLDAHLATSPLPDARVRDVHVDPEIAERLRAMGYVSLEPGAR